MHARWMRAGLILAAVMVLASCVPIPLPRFGGPGPAPIADRDINMYGNCVQTEEDGFYENAQVSVDRNTVRALSWRLAVGKRGSCRFDFAEFRQTQRKPHIEMRARDGSSCKLLMWQDPRRVTLAHVGCEQRCTPGIYEEAWPVMFEPNTGACVRR